MIIDRSFKQSHQVHMAVAGLYCSFSQDLDKKSVESFVSSGDLESASFTLMDGSMDITFLSDV